MSGFPVGSSITYIIGSQREKKIHVSGSKDVLSSIDGFSQTKLRDQIPKAR